jgi:hypothetical protein
MDDDHHLILSRSFIFQLSNFSFLLVVHTAQFNLTQAFSYILRSRNLCNSLANIANNAFILSYCRDLFNNPI